MNEITKQAVVHHEWVHNRWAIIEPYRTDVLKMVERVLGDGIEVKEVNIDFTNGYGILCIMLMYGRNIGDSERREIYRKAQRAGMQAAIWFDGSRQFSVGSLWCDIPKRFEETFRKLEEEWEASRKR